MRLLVEEVLVDAFGLEARNAQLPARPFLLQRSELSFGLDGIGVEFRRGLEPVLAVRRAPDR